MTLVPSRPRAAVWTVVGLLATGLAAYAVGSSEWILFTTTLTALCGIATGVFGLQLLAPETWTLRVDRAGVWGTLATFEVAEPFRSLRAVELDRVAGEAVLVLLGHDHRRRLLLPVGCDLDGLRGVLAEVERAKARGW